MSIEEAKVAARFSGTDGSYEKGDKFRGAPARVAELRKLGLLEAKAESAPAKKD